MSEKGTGGNPRFPMSPRVLQSSLYRRGGWRIMNPTDALCVASGILGTIKEKSRNNAQITLGFYYVRIL